MGEPAPTVAAPAAVSPFFTNERRLTGVFKLSNGFISISSAEKIELTRSHTCHDDVKDLLCVDQYQSVTHTQTRFNRTLLALGQLSRRRLQFRGLAVVHDSKRERRHTGANAPLALNRGFELRTQRLALTAAFFDQLLRFSNIEHYILHRPTGR